MPVSNIVSVRVNFPLIEIKMISVYPYKENANINKFVFEVTA